MDKLKTQIAAPDYGDRPYGHQLPVLAKTVRNIVATHEDHTSVEEGLSISRHPHPDGHGHSVLRVMKDPNFGHVASLTTSTGENNRDTIHRDDIILPLGSKPVMNDAPAEPWHRLDAQSAQFHISALRNKQR